MIREKKHRSSPRTTMIDRIRDAIVDGTELTLPGDIEAMEIIQVIWPVYFQQKSIDGALAILRTMQIGKESNLRKWLNITQQVYGRVEEGTREGRKAVVVETLMRALQKAEAADNFSAVERLSKEIAKLGGMYIDADNQVGLYDSLTLPQPVITTDPAALIMLDPDDVEVDE